MSGNLASQENKRGCFATNKRYLIVLNVIFLILGSAIVAVASWGQQRSEYLHTLIPEDGFNLAIAAGSILLVVSISGVIGTLGSYYKFGRGLLVLYNWMLFLLVILELIAAGMLLAATGTLVRTNVYVPCATMPMLSMIDVTWAQNNSEYGAAAQGKIQQWINQTYYVCCNDTTHTVIEKGCWISGFMTADDCKDQPTFFDTFQQVLSDKLVPITAVLFIAVILQIINIFITYCVIRTSRKFPRFSQRYKRHQEDLEREGRSEGLNHGDFEKRAAAKKPKQPPAQAAHTELVAPKAVKPVKQGGAAVIATQASVGDDDMESQLQPEHDDGFPPPPPARSK